MIETRLLHYFLAVVREQNITKAAQTLFISQSTLSKQMMDLENSWVSSFLYAESGKSH